MDVRLDGEAALIVASQDVERDPGDEVVLRIQANIVGAFTLALVRHSAVERVFGLCLGAINRDMQLEIHGEGKANDVEAGANVGAGARRLDHERLHGGRMLVLRIRPRSWPVAVFRGWRGSDKDCRAAASVRCVVNVSIAKQISKWPGWPRFAVLLKGAKSRKTVVGLLAQIVTPCGGRPDNRSSLEHACNFFFWWRGRLGKERDSSQAIPEISAQSFTSNAITINLHFGDINDAMHVPRYSMHILASLYG